MLDRLALSIAHSRYLEEERKIPCEIAAEMGVVSRGPNIAFEFRKNGVCIYRQVKRETTTEDGERSKTFFIEPKGAALFFWNDDCLSEPLHDPAKAVLIITEGVEDAMSWRVIGATYVVSVPNGTPEHPGEGDINPLDDPRFAYLWVNGRLDPRVDQFKKIILATDGDKAGRVLRDELAIRLGRERCWFVEYPQGTKDTNGVLQKYGFDGVAALLEGAKPIVPSTLVRFSEIPEVERKMYSTGWQGVDPFITLQAPELCVFTGRPGSGKSQLALAIGANLAWNHKMPGAILQFEDDVERNRSDLIRFAMSKMGFDFHDADGQARARAWVDRMFLTIAPPESDADDPEQNLKWLKDTLLEAGQRHACGWSIIDPWNEVEHIWDRGQNEVTYTNNALRELKRIYRRITMIGMIVAHPTKEGGRRDSIEDCSIYDIAGGAAWANKADHGIIAWRENPTAATTYVKSDKVKNHTRMGRPGMFRMRFKPTQATYEFEGVYSPQT